MSSHETYYSRHILRVLTYHDIHYTEVLFLLNFNCESYCMLHTNDEIKICWNAECDLTRIAMQFNRTPYLCQNWIMADWKRYSFEMAWLLSNWERCQFILQCMVFGLFGLDWKLSIVNWRKEKILLKSCGGIRWSTDMKFRWKWWIGDNCFAISCYEFDSLADSHVQYARQHPLSVKTVSPKTLEQPSFFRISIKPYAWPSFFNINLSMQMHYCIIAI